MTCHSSATCENLSKGFCCKCIQGWYGDGKNCLPKDIPQRVTGKVDMCVNDITIEKQELHCYVLTQDGRTYTAISKYGEFFREINFTKNFVEMISLKIIQISKKYC